MNVPISLIVLDSLQVLAEKVQNLLCSAMTGHVKDVCLPVSLFTMLLLHMACHFIAPQAVDRRSGRSSSMRRLACWL